jgi:hypothetical protein
MSRIPNYKPWEIEKLAGQFLADHWSASEISVDIEKIVEADLHIVMEFAPSLDATPVVGAIGLRPDGTFVITVPEKQADEQPTTYRSTIAEEVAHFVLHRELIESVKTCVDASKLHQSFTLDEYRQMEGDAYAFALAVLMPLKQFTDATSDFYTKWFAKIKGAVADVPPDFLLKRIKDELARRYQVAPPAVESRLRALRLEKAIVDSAYRDLANLSTG